MQIFRVEHKPTGSGPYNTSALCLDETYALDSDNLWRAMTLLGQEEHHPCPREDGLGNIANWERCAFDSLNALMAWFPQEVLDLFEKANFFVAVYQVDEYFVRTGGHQVVFDYPYAERLFFL